MKVERSTTAPRWRPGLSQVARSPSELTSTSTRAGRTLADALRRLSPIRPPSNS